MMPLVGFWVVFSLIVSVIADRKGFSAAGFFFLSLLLSPLLGLIIAVARAPNQTRLDQVRVTLGEMKACPFCAEPIRQAAKVCRYCTRDLPT